MEVLGIPITILKDWFMALAVVLVVVILWWVVKKTIENKEQTNKYYVWLSYEPFNRSIIIHFKGNQYLLSSFNYDSPREKLVRYIFKHQNKLITKSDLTEKADVKTKQSLTDLVIKIGFKDQLGKIFFNTSKSTLEFRRVVRHRDVEEMGGIDIKKLNKQIKSLKKITP